MYIVERFTVQKTLLADARYLPSNCTLYIAYKFLFQQKKNRHAAQLISFLTFPVL